MDLSSASAVLKFYHTTRLHTKEDQNLKNYFNLYVVVEVRHVFQYLMPCIYEIGSLVKYTCPFRRFNNVFRVQQGRKFTHGVTITALSYLYRL